jgi:hypothetical protein
MQHRLHQLCFVPPPAGLPWSSPPLELDAPAVLLGDGKSIEIALPLFWYDPPWHHVAAESADTIATAVAQQGILVSALRSDLASPNNEPTLHAEQQTEEPQRILLPRMVPYRPERYGLSNQDFDGATIIDVRLEVNRDTSGRFAYAPEQIERWEATPTNEPLAGGGWVAAATFPPDVVSLQHLSSKLNQLRCLSPRAAVFVSIGAYRLREELLAVLANQPDGVIIRMDQLELDGLQLAKLTQFARNLAIQAKVPDLPLWIVPGEVSADDVAKLITLGASAVAVDHWGSKILAAVIDEGQRSVPALGGYTSRAIGEGFVYSLVEEELLPKVDRTIGLLHSTQLRSQVQPLATLSKEWSTALGVPLLDLFD